jgi:hypothetical protein
MKIYLITELTHSTMKKDNGSKPEKASFKDVKTPTPPQVMDPSKPPVTQKRKRIPLKEDIKRKLAPNEEL